MRKSLAALSLVAMTCAACASAPEHGPGGPGRPGGGPPMAPGLFVSPFGEAFTSQPGEPYPVAAWFAGADTDHDGKLTKAEFQADGDRWFQILDTNKDGLIGPAEIAAYEALAARLTGGMGGPGGPGGGQGMGGRRGGGGPGMGGGMGGGGRPGGPGGPGMGLAEGSAQNEDLPDSSTWGSQRTRSGPAVSAWSMAGMLNVPEPVKSADIDMNQRVTPEEWARTGDRWFQLLDTDRDGVLTLAELPQTQLQQRGGRMGFGGRPR